MCCVSQYGAAIELNELATAPPKMDDVSATVVEVKLGLGGENKPTFVNAASEAEGVQACYHQDSNDDLRTPLKQFLDNPSKATDPKVRRQAVRYLLVDQWLYRRTEDEVLLYRASRVDNGYDRSQRRAMWVSRVDMVD